MNFTKITEEDLLNKGVFGLPDTPGLTTQQMQEKFDELSKVVIIPKFNALIEELEPIKSIERVSDSVEESDKSIPTGNAVKKLVDNKANELAKKPVYKSAGGFPEVGDAFTVYIDDTVSPRLLYTWDDEEGYILTGGSSSGGAVLLEISTDGYNELPEVEKMRDDVQYFISDKGIIKYKDKSYGGNGGDVDIDYSEIAFDTEEIVVENPMEDNEFKVKVKSGTFSIGGETWAYLDVGENIGAILNVTLNGGRYSLYDVSTYFTYRQEGNTSVAIRSVGLPAGTYDYKIMYI